MSLLSVIVDREGVYGLVSGIAVEAQHGTPGPWRSAWVQIPALSPTDRRWRQQLAAQVVVSLLPMSKTLLGSWLLTSIWLHPCCLITLKGNNGTPDQDDSVFYMEQKHSGLVHRATEGGRCQEASRVRLTCELCLLSGNS